MAYAIIAEPVLGTYHGHVGDGELDTVPSPARLVAALLCAAAQGPRAEQYGNELGPCELDAVALRWLENHPPDGMRVPRVVENRPGALAYRRRVREVRNKRQVIFPKPYGLDSVAVDGPFAWTWDTGPPAGLREAIAGLCADVSHLGMAETPVRVRVGTAEPTHDLAPDADWWNRAAGDLDVDVAADGRTAALIDAYNQTRTPAPAKEKNSPNEADWPPARVEAGVVAARYTSRTPAPPALPWAEALVAELDQDLPGAEAERVRWAVAVHKALIKMIGYGAPPMLTGKYAPGVERPANRCAIQLLSRAEAALCGSAAKSLLVLMMPTGIDGAEHEVIASAWTKLRALHPHPDRRVKVLEKTRRRADQFWDPPVAGRRRVWRTVPAAVPETRGQGKGWTLADAIRLSAAMVLREQLGVPAGKGGAWYRDLVAATSGRVEVTEAVPVRDGDLSRFVHKIPEHLPLRPYRAVIDLDPGLVPPRGLLALGQARHLGNGLLVPDDLTVGGLR